MQANNTGLAFVPDKAGDYRFGMKTLRTLRDAAGLTQAELAEKAGTTQPQIMRLEGGRRKLTREWAARLAPALGVSPQSLLYPDGDDPQESNARVGASAPMVTKIPAYGHAVGGRDGQFILNGNKIADILAPSQLAGVRDAYAVYVVGESMVPRYSPGEAVFVNPRLPVRRGDWVVAQIAADEGEAPYAYVKQFIGQDRSMLRLQQLKPKKVLSFPSAKVVSVHRIIMGGDG